MMIPPEAELKRIQALMTGYLNEVKKNNPQMASTVEDAERNVTVALSQIEFWGKLAQSNEADYSRYNIALLWLNTNLEKIITTCFRVAIENLGINLAKMVSPEWMHRKASKYEKKC